MFADKLRELRRARNLTQAQLAEQLGVSTSAVGMYEQGRREPDSAMLARMASCLCTSIDNLLCVGGVPQQPAQTEVDEIIDGFAHSLLHQEGLMFHGEPLSAADREKLANAIRIAAAVTSNSTNGGF